MLSETITNFFQSFQPLQPAMAGAGSVRNSSASSRQSGKLQGMMFASGSGSGGGGDDDWDEYADDDYVEPAQETRRNPGAPRARGTGSGGGGGGRSRTIDFQPEERYWTEYLRIALPIIGLLLMIGLFWYWASQLTNDDKKNDPTGTQPPGTTELITPDSTPVATKPPVVQPTTPSNTPSAQATTPPTDGDTTPTGDETTPTTDGDFAEGDFVIITDGPVRMREDSSIDSEIVAELPTETVLEVISGPVEGGEYQWYQVRVESDGDFTGQTGWVASDFIELAPDNGT